MKKYKITIITKIADDEIIGAKEEIICKLEDVFEEIKVDFVEVKELPTNIQTKFI